jgi:hypothetical protein
MLTAALRDYARDSPIDLVYINNTAILHLEDSVFKVTTITYSLPTPLCR